MQIASIIFQMVNFCIPLMKILRTIRWYDMISNAFVKMGVAGTQIRSRSKAHNRCATRYGYADVHENPE